MARGEPGQGERGGQENIAEALSAPRPDEGCHGLPKTLDRTPVVALGLVGSSKILVRQRMQDNIPAGCGERESALSGSDSLVVCSLMIKMECQKAGNLSQPTLVVEGLRESLGLTQSRQDTLKIA